MKTVLTIAGSDSSGGAGIQADLKTIEALGLYATTAITALTAQNTTGVFGVHNVPADFVSAQIAAVFDDIRPDAVKVGMVSSAHIAAAIASSLASYQAPNIVVDPVMVATSGASLAENDAVAELVRLLFPQAKVVTPNIPEACALSGMSIETEADQVRAARAILELGSAFVLVKGGHGSNDANDVLVSASGDVSWYRAKRIDTPNTHGTGCTLSSAIACYLALGCEVPEAVGKAKDYLIGALSAGLDLGKGSGPLDHKWARA